MTRPSAANPAPMTKYVAAEAQATLQLESDRKAVLLPTRQEIPLRPGRHRVAHGRQGEGSLDSFALGFGPHVKVLELHFPAPLPRYAGQADRHVTEQHPAASAKEAHSRAEDGPIPSWSSPGARPARLVSLIGICSVTSDSRYLAMEVKISSGVLVHLKVRGFSFQVFAHFSMERASSVIERCALLGKGLVVSSDNRRSTRFIQEE